MRLLKNFFIVAASAATLFSLNSCVTMGDCCSDKGGAKTEACCAHAGTDKCCKVTGAKKGEDAACCAHKGTAQCCKVTGKKS